eukprot:1714628-Pleurochrysis_carterae.AAC.1
MKKDLTYPEEVEACRAPVYFAPRGVALHQIRSLPPGLFALLAVWLPMPLSLTYCPLDTLLPFAFSAVLAVEGGA